MPRALKLLVIMLVVVPVPLMTSTGTVHAECPIETRTKDGLEYDVLVCSDEVSVVRASQLTSVRRSVCTPWEVFVIEVGLTSRCS